MSLTVQQLLSDAKRLTGRLRDHDSATDGIISAAQDVLKEVEAMRQYQEDIESLNTIAHNRPRAQLVLGIQQENRHIRQLQHENKELRAALEEHQNVLELIMSKYREHMSCLVNSTKIEKDMLIRENSKVLQDRADKICEMANVMQKSIQIDEDSMVKQQELMARLVTENKGLREMLEISHRNGSYSNPLVGPRLVSAACQTEEMVSERKIPSNHQQQSNSASFKIMSSKNPDSHEDVSDGINVKGSKNSAEQCSNSNCTSPLRTDSANSSNSSNSSTSSESSLVMNGGKIQIETDAVSSPQRPLSSASEESESSISEDDEISFNTIKRGAGLKLKKTHSNLLVAVKQTAVNNPELADNNIVKSCDVDTTCSSSAVNQINLTSLDLSEKSVKCHGDFETGGDHSLQTTNVPPLQINGGTVLHTANDTDSMNSDETLMTRNAANREDNNNGHTNQSDENETDSTSHESSSGAVQDNVIFQAKSKQLSSTVETSSSGSGSTNITATSMS